MAVSTGSRRRGGGGGEVESPALILTSLENLSPMGDPKGGNWGVVCSLEPIGMVVLGLKCFCKWS